MPCESFACFKPGKALCGGLSRGVESYPEQGGLSPRARMQLGVKLWTFTLDVTVHALHYTEYEI